MNRHDEEFMIQKIRMQYTEKGPAALDKLKELDAKAKRPATVFAYVFGSLGAIVLGSGMSLIMTDIADVLNFIDRPMPVGIAIGIVGLIITTVNYPIYRAILNSRKRKYSDRILKLSEELMNNKEL